MLTSLFIVLGFSQAYGYEKDIDKLIIDQCRNSSDFNWCVKQIKRIVNEQNRSKGISDSSNKFKNKRIFDLCKDARDFQGCVNTYSNSNRSNIKNSDDLDFLGMPKLREEDGWVVIEDRVNRMINYLSLDVRKVKVRGIYGRYISYPQVLRFYSEP